MATNVAAPKVNQPNPWDKLTRLQKIGVVGGGLLLLGGVGLFIYKQRQKAAQPAGVSNATQHA